MCNSRSPEKAHFEHSNINSIFGSELDPLRRTNDAQAELEGRLRTLADLSTQDPG